MGAHADRIEHAGVAPREAAIEPIVAAHGEAPGTEALQTMQRALNASVRHEPQRRLQHMLAEGPRATAQASLAATLAQRGSAAGAGAASGGEHERIVSGGSDPAAAVAQRRPVSTGTLLRFFDDEIPAPVTLV